MISFKEYVKEQLLLEYDQAKTLQNFGTKLVANKDPDLKGKSAEEIITKLEECDPTKKKTYVQWIVKQFLNGIKYEDLSSTGKDWLSFFESNKQKLPTEYKDINELDFSNLGDLYLEYKEQDLRSNRKKDKEIKEKNAKKIYEDSNWTVIVPLNEEAACLYGSGTKWCTAAKSNNRFDLYTKDKQFKQDNGEDSKIYIFIPKNPKHKNEKYQVHIESAQIMGDNNKPVKNKNLINEFLNIIKNYSKIKYNFTKIKIKHNIEFEKGEDDISNITDMSYMFTGSKFNQDISGWVTSKVTDMSYMFYKSSFNQPIGNWDVSKVVNMSSMFDSSEFNQDISQWDVSAVTNMAGMFYGASKFNQDISQWDVYKVTDIEFMFYYSAISKNEKLFTTIIKAWRKKNPIFNNIKLPGE